MTKTADLNRINAKLVNASLQAYLKHNPGTTSWIKQPNNLISVVAISLSILGVVYGFYKDWKDTINKNKQALAAIITDLTKLDTDFFSIGNQPTKNIATAGVQPGNQPTPVVANGFIDAQAEQVRLTEYRRTLTNRRLVLLAEADRLTDELGEGIPLNELMVLAVSFGQVAQYEKAVRYFEKVTTQSTSRVAQLTGWRAIGLVNAQRGPEFIEATRTAFSKASQAIPESKDAVAMYGIIEAYQPWADFEFGINNYRVSVELLLRAKHQLVEFPCQAGKSKLLTLLDNEIQSKLTALDTRAADIATPLRAEVSNIPADKCLG